MTNTQKFIFILSNENSEVIRNLGSFIFKSMAKRNNIWVDQQGWQYNISIPFLTRHMIYLYVLLYLLMLVIVFVMVLYFCMYNLILQRK